MNTWQPIDTAPKDYDNVVLLVVGNGGGFSESQKRVVTGILQTNGCTDYWWVFGTIGSHRATENFIGFPTHWMPLPPPPKEINHVKKRS